VLPTHRLIRTYRGHEIYLRQPGFEFTPVMLGKVASFLVGWTDGLAVFAFMYPMLAQVEEQDFSEERLLQQAAELIELWIDEERIQNRSEFTFEYRGGAFVEASDPRWWVKVLW
jgi:hypothetical protein